MPVKIRDVNRKHMQKFIYLGSFLTDEGNATTRYKIAVKETFQSISKVMRKENKSLETKK